MLPRLTSHRSTQEDKVTHNKTYLTFQDVCELLNISSHHLRSLIFKKKIPYTKIGRLVRFERNDLTTWLQSKKQIGEVNDK